MISLIIWGLVLASIYDVIRYAVQRAAYPKHPLQFCPQCGQKLPAHHEACTWRPPKKPAPPIGSIILVSICALITIFGMYVDSASPSAAPVIYSSPIPSRTPWPGKTPIASTGDKSPPTTSAPPFASSAPLSALNPPTHISCVSNTVVKTSTSSAAPSGGLICASVIASWRAAKSSSPPKKSPT